MEGMLEMEAQRLEEQLELERRQVRRNRLQLVSAVAQWIVLLSCLVYFGLGFLHPPTTPKSQWIEVAATDYVPKEKRINISWNRGTMNVRNLSIPIYCDGFYLVSLKGTIRAMPQRNASLSLKVYKRSDASILCVKVTEEVVDSVTVSEMRFKDEVYLEANRDANYKDLTLGLFLLTPRSHCLPDAYKM
ncbi:tumor necrosis factor ligand superfamily member 4-like [Terrapene carolina triunguis]|uniref:tumor necrosis factor ligand superfamily member 4-like n=1 Tax=Terrapene triunguis TaxID=2587831 RepID=UPI001156A740|nr:tumor necrosis factor ligand superfamily member 4-like [Terrapene carolina triunguis]